MARRSAASKEEKAAQKELLTGQMKAFKSSSEVTNFYRFIHENNLRHEAKVLLEKVVQSLKGKRKTRSKSKNIQ
ncbi:MAG: hypothetical protein H6621_02825 [Halobacteriovoraceae bacterium]|nr:hypothetical protein [Halobacteriovoraceae bacterium]MCB9093978.1 hypothetical protein [Halobacteriovoraceae bacterium]